MNIILIFNYGKQAARLKKSMYEDLNRIYESTPKSHQKIILGNFNAKVGKEKICIPTIGKENLHTLSNDNGNLQ